MKTINKLKIALAGGSLLFMSCTNDITELNQNPKAPEADAVDPSYVFASAEMGTFSLVANTSVNLNNFKMFTQQMTETQYTDEAKYNLVKRSMPDNFWNQCYFQLNRLKITKDKVVSSTIDAGLKANQLATIEALEIYIYSMLVDTYGDVPYSQAIKVDQFLSPKYDDGLTIYKDLISRANSAIASIDLTKGTFASDRVFGNNASNILRFLNSLKLRMGLNLADLDNAYAKTVVESAYTSGLPTSNAQSLVFKFDKEGLFTSTIYQDMVQSGRNDYVAANTLVNYMNGKADPRRDKYFTLGPGAVFVGGNYGAVNNYANFSHINDALLVADYGYNIFSYAETELMLAEAAERGYSVGGSASVHFTNGIDASMDAYGVSAAAKAAYLASNVYATLTGTWKEKIGHELWVANFFRGYEAWVVSKRLDFRVFVKPSTFDVPLRLPYPVKENAVNKNNKDAAAVKQWGSVANDVQGKKVFWDIN